jgi:mono/diheme cytochrome c family protein
MMRFPLGCCLVFWFISSAWAQSDPLYVTPQEAAKDPDFAVQGEYAGDSRAMQVIALGDGDFEAVVYAGGLPGAGWNGTPASRLELDANGVNQLAAANGMQRVERTSPTLGQKPPAGAIVLFDGTAGSLEQHWKPGAKITEDGLLTENATSLDTFQDYFLHVEFRTPFRPQARGQQRGNSGVYHQGRYENQVLDSFGLQGKNNEAGGIYSIRDPDLNMCFPPLSWQTYDCEFTAAKFDESGKKVANPRLTVRLNGVVVQQDVELPKSTTAAPVKEGPEPGPIYLQGHGNPVRFRNIWIRPRDVAKEARRPIVPGFERFFATSDDQASSGGRVLLTELSCTACHATPLPTLTAKQGPILDAVGSRIRPDYLLEFIEHPHQTKPGTTMPDMLGQLPVDERKQAAEAITSFLMTTGKVTDQYGNPKAINRGRNLFHTTGCTACHAPDDGTDVPLATTVPLAGVSRKYTLESLSSFLKNPHAVRPSGRMPSFALSDQQAADVATYLLSDVIVGAAAENMRAAFYDGNWEQLPDFDELTPKLVTKTYGLDLRASGKRNLERFGARFESFFSVAHDANYRFHLASDDGSRLLIDGQVVVDNDGVHPMNWKTGTVELAKGTHSIRIDYFELGGQEGLEVEIEGGGLPRTPIETLASLDPQGARPRPVLETKFSADEKLVAKGRELFVSTGCAACHQLQENGQRIAAKSTAPALELLPGADPQVAAGCLAEQPLPGVPNYELSPAQQASITAALKELRDAPEKRE